MRREQTTSKRTRIRVKPLAGDEPATAVQAGTTAGAAAPRLAGHLARDGQANTRTAHGLSLSQTNAAPAAKRAQSDEGGSSRERLDERRGWVAGAYRRSAAARPENEIGGEPRKVGDPRAKREASPRRRKGHIAGAFLPLPCTLRASTFEFRRSSFELSSSNSRKLETRIVRFELTLLLPTFDDALRNVVASCR